MGKVLKPLALVAGVALQLVPGVGNAVGGLFLKAGLGALGATVATGALSVGLAAYGSSGGGRRGAAPTLTAFDPRSINPDPAAPRTLVFGRTTFPVTLKYAEPSGTNDEFIDYVFRLASHKSTSIEEIWIDDTLAWTVGGGAQGIYAGFLTIETVLEAGPAAFHVVNGGATWGASTRLTGSTTMRVRVKRSENSKTSQSPFASGISGRWAVIGRGMPVYDPALDSTVPGGSGSQRADNNATWAYTAGVERGNNPALQLLAFLLGWKINGVGSVGCGFPPDVIDLPSFAVAAAICDEPVALAGGGSQRRFEAGRAFTDDDDPLAVIAELLKAMNGELVDDGGRLSLRIAINDLTPALTLTDDDFVGGYDWRPQPGAQAQFTVVRGNYSEPAAPSLFGQVDYPEVAVPRTSLVPRALNLDLSAVQDQRRAERIAKQAAQRSLYPGEFEVTLGIRGWLLKRNMVVAIDSDARGWTGKLFRVRSLTFNTDASVAALFQEENAAIYAWDADESAQVTPVTPPKFDSRKAASWLMAGISAGATTNEDGGGNLIAAPADSNTWIPFNGAVLTDVVAPLLNGRAGAMSANGQGIIWNSVLFPVTPGETLFFRHVVAGDAFVPPEDYVAGAFNFFDRNGVLLSGAGTAVQALGSEVTSAQAFNTAFRAEGKCIVPSGAALARAYSIRIGGSGVGTFYVNQPRAARDAVGADPTGATLPTLTAGNWVTGRFYATGTIVQFGSGVYTARLNHTSDNSNAPPSATIWRNLATTGDGTSSAGIAFVANSTSYGAEALQFVVRAGATGNVDLTSSMAVDADPNNTADYGAAGKWQIFSGGVWTDLAAETVAPGLAYPPGPGTSLVINTTAGSLAPNTTYSFRLLLRRTGAGPGTDVVNLVGQATGNGR